MNYDMKKTGLRIQQLRTQSGYTQEEFAKALNIDRSNLSRIESGKRGCSVDLLVQFSCWFDVTLDYLILGKEKNDSVPTNSKAHLKEGIDTLIKQLETFKQRL